MPARIQPFSLLTQTVSNAFARPLPMHAGLQSKANQTIQATCATTTPTRAARSERLGNLQFGGQYSASVSGSVGNANRAVAALRAKQERFSQPANYPATMPGAAMKHIAVSGNMPASAGNAVAAFLRGSINKPQFPNRSRASAQYSTRAEASSMISSTSIKALLPKARAPQSVAMIGPLDQNDVMSPLFHRHLLVKASASEQIVLPAELEFVRPLIERAVAFEKQLQGQQFRSERCFLTVRRSVMTYDAKNPQTKVEENVRDLWHYDGANPPENSRLDSIYSYAYWKSEGFPENYQDDAALSTHFYTGSLPPLPDAANLGEDMALYLQLAPKQDDLITAPEKGELVHWSGLHPHRSPFLGSDQLFKDAGVVNGRIARTFIRMTFVDDRNFTNSNNCHINMDMFPHAYSAVMSPESVQTLADRASLNDALSRHLARFSESAEGLLTAKVVDGALRLSVKLSETLAMQTQALSKSDARKVSASLDPASALKWALVNKVKTEFSIAPLSHYKGTFDADKFRKAWEVGMSYGPVREELLAMHRRGELFAPDVTLETIKSSFDQDIAAAKPGAERTRLFMEKNEFIAIMHPSPLKETVNLWRQGGDDSVRREQMQAMIDKAIADPVNPFAQISALRSALIVNSGKDLLDKSKLTNDFVDLLGERKTLARYLSAVLSHQDSFNDLVKANQARQTHSVYGHTQLRVTQDLQTVLGVWVPLNFDKSAHVAGDDLVPFGEFNSDILSASKDFIAIEPPHNHHFDFSSKVVMGDFFQTTYDVVPYAEEVKTSKRMYDEEGRHWHLGMRQVGWAWPEHDEVGAIKNLRGNGTVSMKEGDVYYCYQSVIHAPVLNRQGETAVSLHAHAHEHGVTPYFYFPESMYTFHTQEQETISKGKTTIDSDAIRGLFQGIQQILENSDPENNSTDKWLETYNKFVEAPEFNLLEK